MKQPNNVPTKSAEGWVRYHAKRAERVARKPRVKS
jgi:hypothetical protein